MAPSKVGLMVERFERKYAPGDTQGTRSKNPQRRRSELVRPPSKQRKSTWFNTHPWGPEHMQQSIDQDSSTSDEDAVPTITSRAVQETHIDATRGSSCAGDAGAKGELHCEALGVEHESFDNTSSTQRHQHSGQSLSTPAVRRNGAEPKPSGTYVPPHRRPVRIKTENASPQTPSPEIPQRNRSNIRNRVSPIRVASPVAEKFYRSAVIKLEEGGELPDEKEVPSRNQHPTESMYNPETPHPDVKVKLQRSSQEYYIPTGASDDKFLAQPIPSRTFRVFDSVLLHGAGVQHRPTDSISTLNLNAPETLASPPPRPDTKLSYLKPLTPTPFSTPYGFTNPAPYAANLHFVSGSLLEGMRRRTKWADRATRLPKQTIPVRCDAPAEPQCGVEYEYKEEEPQQEGGYKMKTCAWYKLPFCGCCRWTRTAMAQCPDALVSSSHVGPGRDEHLIQEQRDASAPRKAVKKRKWWQFPRRKFLADSEQKRRLVKRSGYVREGGKRVPQLNVRRRRYA
jgi:hypothetical protein